MVAVSSYVLEAAVREGAAKREEGFMGLRVVAGGILGLLGMSCAVVGIFVLEGISIELPGIILGALSYYFVTTSKDRARSDP
jgi:hypothetical protein